MSAGARSAREEIFARIRRNLVGQRPSRAAAAERASAPAPEPQALEARIERFREVLEEVGGRCHRARGEREAAAALRAIVAEAGARDVATSDSELVRRLVEALPAEVQRFDGWTDRERLLACGAGVTSAQWGIAETGTLVLESDAERHRLASLVPPVHVAVLEAERILSTLGEALERVHRDDPGRMSRAVTLITGPSRTADIELELVIGVHGPRELHVVVLENG